MFILGLPKPMKKNIIVLFMIFCGLNHIYAQSFLGSKLAGMGNNGAAVKDIWSVEANMAGITSISSPSIAINYVNLFFENEISQQAFAFILPIRNNYLGFSLQRYGITEFNEIKAGFAYAKKFSNKLSIGIKGNYHQIKINNYGETTGFTADVGIMYSLDRYFTFGLYLNNPGKQKYIDHTILNNIPSTVNAGVSYQASNKILIATIIRKELNATIDVGIGLDYQLLEVISLRGGITMKPFKQYGGIGFNHKKFILDLALENDPNLGYSPQITLAYAF